MGSLLLQGAQNFPIEQGESFISKMAIKGHIDCVWMCLHFFNGNPIAWALYVDTQGEHKQSVAFHIMLAFGNLLFRPAGQRNHTFLDTLQAKVQLYEMLALQEQALARIFFCASERVSDRCKCKECNMLIMHQIMGYANLCQHIKSKHDVVNARRKS